MKFAHDPAQHPEAARSEALQKIAIELEIIRREIEDG